MCYIINVYEMQMYLLLLYQVFFTVHILTLCHFGNSSSKQLQQKQKQKQEGHMLQDTHVVSVHVPTLRHNSYTTMSLKSLINRILTVYSLPGISTSYGEKK